ncbi:MULTISPECIES: hypothetical protein [unclassified Nocardiopsis]|uniref:hypothetical protein n=1 Tax=Nocardiopsis TaxID=2013 RepID=UPI00387AA8C7
MSTLPYTYTDPSGDSITVNDELRRGLQIKETLGETAFRAAVHVPTGPDAVALARAVLAAAGNTGCEVVAAEDMAKMRRAAMEAAATVMRERAAEVCEGDPWAHGEDTSDKIRALPLLPAPAPLTDNT